MKERFFSYLQRPCKSFGMSKTESIAWQVINDLRIRLKMAEIMETDFEGNGCFAQGPLHSTYHTEGIVVIQLRLC